jgi:membrane protease YdiL (CAAX protease family)
LLILLMATPALSALIVEFFFEPRQGRARRLGLIPLALQEGRPPSTGWGAFFLVLGLSWVVPIAASVVAPLISVAFGLTQLDLVGLSGMKLLVSEGMRQAGQDPEALWSALSPHVFLGLQLVNVVIGSLINTVPCFGEELGWRGFLLPRLRALGTVPALLVSGALWGVWQAPIILMGHNYPTQPVLGVPLFVVFCVLWGIVFGWTRLRTGSVWPAVLMHGALNAAAGLSVLLLAAGAYADTVWVGIVSIPGLIIPLVLAGILAATGELRRFHEA